MPSPLAPRTVKITTVSGGFGYYPFGMMQEGRQFVGGMGYRWGFGGYEYLNSFDPKASLYLSEYRLYNSMLCRWNSVDPLEQFHSSYLAIANNPVAYRDPDGRWVPSIGDDGRIMLKKEKGDNRASLYDFLGQGKGDYTLAETNSIWRSRRRGFVNLPENRFSNASKDALTGGLPISPNDITNEERDNLDSKGSNCYFATNILVQGKDYYPSHSVESSQRISSDQQLQPVIKAMYISVDKDEAIFGKTFVRFATDKTEGKSDELLSTVPADELEGLKNRAQHAAVFFGRDRNGTEYYYSKNGYTVRPSINTAAELSAYGQIKGYNGDKTGYYNLRTR
jgi:RHS repeat-associated protein